MCLRNAPPDPTLFSQDRYALQAILNAPHQDNDFRQNRRVRPRQKGRFSLSQPHEVHSHPICMYS